MKKQNNESIQSKRRKNQNLTPVEVGDYYVEKGFYVFTAQYHKKRGYCCKNNCRHCPYGNREIEEEK